MVVKADVLEELLAARTSALLRTAFLLTGHEEAARDLLQSALERVARRLASIREPQALEAYLRTAMATTAANNRRRFWSRERATGYLPEQAVEAPDTDTRLVLVAALRRLPPEQRAVLVLRYFEDLSEADTAATLGIPVGTVKSRASRAVASLRESGIALVQEAE